MNYLWFGLACVVVALIVGAIMVAEVRRARFFRQFEARRTRPEAWVSWYRAPFRPIEYLALMPPAEYDDGGWYYVREIERAHRFASEAEALKPTPVYDGSDDIESRAGVLRVFA